MPGIGGLGAAAMQAARLLERPVKQRRSMRAFAPAEATLERRVAKYKSVTSGRRIMSMLSRGRSVLAVALARRDRTSSPWPLYIT